MGRRGGRRSDYQWQGDEFAVLNQTGTQTVVPIGTFNTPGTLMRSRGRIQAALDGPADNDIMEVGVGLVIGTDDQVSAGGTTFPSPLNAMDEDWIWHHVFSLSAQSATQSEAWGLQCQQKMIDSKAMRRVKQNEQLVLIVDPLQVSGTPTVDLLGYVRALLAS